MKALGSSRVVCARVYVETAPSKPINSSSRPICYWLLNISYWLFEGRERIAPIANSR